LSKSVLAAVTRKIFNDPLYLAKLFFSSKGGLFYLPFGEFHRKIITSLVNSVDVFTAIVVARGFGKTNLVTILYTIWSVFVRKRRYAILISYSQTKSAKNLRRIRNCIRNKFFQKVFKFKIVIDNVALLQIRLSDGSICTIEAKGIKQPIFGAGEGAARPDLIILDDLETIKTARNPILVAELMDWFSVEITWALSHKDSLGREGQIVLIGTPLDVNAFLAKVMNWKINIQKYPALYKDENGDWQSIWPEMWTVEALLKKRDDMIRKGLNAAWLSQMMLDPGALRVLKFEYNKMTKVTPDEIKSNVSKNLYEKIIITVDMAYTTETYSDYTAIVVGGHMKGMKVDFIESFRGKWSPDELFFLLWDLKVKYGNIVEGIYVETLQYNWIREFFREFGFREKGAYLDIFPMERPKKYYTQGKDDRVGMMVPYYNYGQIRICEEDNYPLVTDLGNWDGKNAKDLDVADAASFHLFFMDESTRESEEKDLGDPRYDASAHIHKMLKKIEKLNGVPNDDDDYFADCEIEENENFYEEEETYDGSSFDSLDFL
jgi:hypothetical protein